jgi:hypothetical protein
VWSAIPSSRRQWIRLISPSSILKKEKGFLWILTMIASTLEVHNMTVLCDYTEIIGDNPRSIPQTTGSAQVALPDFNTGGREAGTGPSRNALLILSARNLTGSAAVFINNVNVGSISATPGTAFSMQSISVTGNQLKDGNNEIVLRNVTDPFELKNVVCFFHQSD